MQCCLDCKDSLCSLIIFFFGVIEETYGGFFLSLISSKLTLKASLDVRQNLVGNLFDKQDQESNRRFHGDTEANIMEVRVFSWNRASLNDLIREAHIKHRERVLLSQKLDVYVSVVPNPPSMLSFRMQNDVDPERLKPSWRRLQKPNRPLTSIVFDDPAVRWLVDDVKKFRSKTLREFYNSRGLPFTRGYVLYGPPGCGERERGKLNLQRVFFPDAK